MTQGDGWVDFMTTFLARSTAFAGVILAAVLGSAPARASCMGTCEFAFAGVSNDADLVLTLSNGTSITIAATTQGNVTNFGVPMFGVPSTNYLAGLWGSASYENFFDFTLPSENAGVTVTSASLTLSSGLINSSLTYTLLGPTAVISKFTPRAPNQTLYNELGAGTTYATYLLSPNTSSPAAQLSEIMVALNAAAVSKLNSEIHGSNQKFLIAGSVAAAPIPEPSSWVMLLAGFAGLGVVARRRAVKRRAAAPAG